MSYEPQQLRPANTNVADAMAFECVITFGAASILKVLGKDIMVVRNSAGNYTLFLPQVYRKLCNFDGIAQIAAGTCLFPIIALDNSGVASTTAPNAQFLGGGSVTFEMRTAAGVPTDPTANDKVSLTLSLSRNFLNDKYEV